MPRRRLVFWWLAYLATMSLVVAGLWEARRRVLADLAQPAAATDWEQWRKDVAGHPDRLGPVERRPVKSPEPPALVLFRDRFGAIVGVSLLTGSFLFGFLAFTIQGALRTGTGLPAGGDQSGE